MDGVFIKCKDCEFWKPIDSDTVFIDTGYEAVGKCTELNCTDRVEIDLRTGWGGGYIEKITTTENFFCGTFVKKKCKMCGKTSEYCACPE